MPTLRARIPTLTAADRTLARALELCVGAGDRLFVRGPSGSGKTRLLRALAGLDPVDGVLTLDERSPTELGWPTWRARVALVPQRVPALPGTPRDLHVRANALRTSPPHPDDPARHLPAWGLDPALLDQRWASLSGGEAQRLLLAVILARRPDVLLLDEPTSALDPAAALAVEATLADHPAVWVTHDADQAERLATATLHLTAPEGAP